MAIALLSPGHMGSAVGRRLIGHGAEVFTCLEGRTGRTRTLAQTSGIRSLATLDELVERCDLILSVIAPAEAHALAVAVADAIRRTGRTPTFADCNAVSPDTARSIGALVQAAGADFADGSIIGPPPEREGTTRFYVSGPATGPLVALNDRGLDVRAIGDSIGAASALKMSYAALTKGTQALAIQLLVTAGRNDVLPALLAELDLSVPQLLRFLETRIPTVPMKSRRWVAEMREIERSFVEAGLPPGAFEGIARAYEWVGTSPLAEETPETRDRSRDMRGVVDELSTHRATTARGEA